MHTIEVFKKVFFSFEALDKSGFYQVQPVSMEFESDYRNDSPLLETFDLFLKVISWICPQIRVFNIRQQCWKLTKE